MEYKEIRRDRFKENHLFSISWNAMRPRLKQMKWKNKRETGGLTFREKHKAKDQDEVMHFAVREMTSRTALFSVEFI